MASTNILYLNNGDGTFTDGTVDAGLDRRGANKIGTFCDYDRDGDLDLYLLTYLDDMADRPCEFIRSGNQVLIHPDFREWYGFVGDRVMEAGESDCLYRNNGDGTFTDVTASAGLTYYAMGLSASWFDYDGDGWQDIYVSNDFWQPDHLFRNQGDGTFKDVLPLLARHTPWFSMGSDTGDLNNDGLIDLMVADMSATNHYRQKLNMGGMQDTAWFLDQTYPKQYMRNCLYINTGVDRFMESAFISGLESTDWTWAVRLADLDNDGLQDVYVTNGHARDSMNADIVNEKEAQREAGQMDELLAANIATPPVKETNAAFRNNGGFKFEEIGEQWGLDHNGISHGVALADFDADGDLDMVVNNLYEPASVYRNNIGSGNSIVFELRCLTNNSFGYGTTIEVRHGETNQIRTLTPVRGYISSDAPKLHFGLGNDEAVDEVRITWPDGSVQQYSSLPANRLYRVLESKEEFIEAAGETSSAETLFAHESESFGLDFTHKESSHDDFEREPLLPYKLSQLGPGIAVGDINGDGFDDIYLPGSSAQTGQMYVNRGGERMEALHGPWREVFQCDQMSAVFFDADSDGDLDLYVVCGGNESEPGSFNYRDKLFFNLGDEKFEAAGSECLPEDLRDSGGSVAAADFDRDGDLDLFVGGRSVPHSYPETPYSRLLRNDGGVFTDAAMELGGEGLSKPGLVNSAIWSDYDNDGWTDLLIALEWGPVKVFRNNEGALEEVTATLGLDGYRGWWKGIAAGDGTIQLAGTGSSEIAEIQIRWPDGETGLWKPGDETENEILISR